MSSLTKKDYVKILEYYDDPIPNSYKQLKKRAETILANKLCRCIKKVSSPKDEERGIGICTRSIFNKKGLTRGTFKCKKSIKNVSIKKTKKSKTQKANKKSKKNTRKSR